MKIKAKVDKRELRKLDAFLKDKKQFKSAINKAVNETAKKTQAHVSSRIIEQEGLNLRPAAVKRVIKMERSKAATLTAKITIERKRRVPLKDFGARQGNQGVSYKIRKADGTKMIPGAFKVRSYKQNVYKRPGQTRAVGGRKKGPSVWGFFRGRKMKKDVVAFARKQLTKEIQERIRVITLKRAGAI